MSDRMSPEIAAMLDAIRAMLGLDPLYAPPPPIDPYRWTAWPTSTAVRAGMVSGKERP